MISLKSSDLTDEQVHNILVLEGWECIHVPDDWEGLKRRGAVGIVWRDLEGLKRHEGKYEWIHNCEYEPDAENDNIAWYEISKIPKDSLRAMFDVLVKEGIV